MTRYIVTRVSVLGQREWLTFEFTWSNRRWRAYEHEHISGAHASARKVECGVIRKVIDWRKRAQAAERDLEIARLELGAEAYADQVAKNMRMRPVVEAACKWFDNDTLRDAALWDAVDAYRKAKS